MGRGVEQLHLPQSSTFTIMNHHLSLRHASPSSWSYCSHRCLMSGHVSGQPSSAINLPDQPHPSPSNNSSLTHVSPLLRSGHESSTLTLTYPHGCLKSCVELMTCTVASKITASVGVTHAVRGASFVVARRDARRGMRVAAEYAGEHHSLRTCSDA